MSGWFLTKVNILAISVVIKCNEGSDNFISNKAILKITPVLYLSNLDNIQRVCLQFTHMGLVWKTEFQPTWLLASCILILQVPDSSYCWKEKYCKLNNSFFSRTWRNKVTYHTHTQKEDSEFPLPAQVWSLVRDHMPTRHSQNKTKTLLKSKKA